MHLQTEINILVPLALIVMMAAIGLDVAIDKVIAVARDWRLLARATAANYVLVPAATVGLLLAFRAAPMISLGFLILATCPGAPFGPIFTAFGRGNVAVAVGLMIVLAASSAMVAPLLLYLLIPLVAGDLHLEIDAARMVLTLLVTQLLPLCAGLGARHYLPAAAAKMVRPVNRVSAVLGLVSITLILVAQYRTLLDIRPRGLLGMLTLLAVSLAVGWWLGGRNQQDRRAMSLTTSLRNVGVALVIANKAFAGSAVVTAVVAYALVELLGSLAFALLPRIVRKAGVKPVALREQLGARRYVDSK